MGAKDKLANRIKYLCKQNHISYYTLSYKAAVPMTTLMHIFDSEEFIDIEYEE